MQRGTASFCEGERSLRCSSCKQQGHSPLRRPLQLLHMRRAAAGASAPVAPRVWRDA